MSYQNQVVVKNKKHQKDLTVLKLYAEVKGWTVIESNEHSASVTTKTVFIKRKSTPENKVYFLMHELGHLALHESSNYPARFASLKTRSDSNPHRTTRVYEEFEAWNEGEKLALNLGIKINQEKFLRLKSRCLMSYIEWACRPKLLKHEKYEKMLDSDDDDSSVVTA